MSGKRFPIATSVAAAILGLAVALKVLGPPNHAPQPPSAQPPAVLLNSVDPTNAPIGSDAETTTLSRAEGAAPFTVLEPSTKLASDQTVTQVWARYDTDPAVGIQYQSGIDVLESPAPSTDYPTGSFYKELSVDLPGASVTTLNDAPAMVIETVDSQNNPASVDVILGGVRVSVLGLNGQSVNDLTTLVQSLPATGPGQPTSSNSSPSVGAQTTG
jgi:hypothetical protein